jgi:hypothetical protein
MSIETYIHDGSAWRKAKQIHVHSGSAWRKAKRGYCHDGTAWKLVYSDKVYTVISGAWTELYSTDPVSRGTRIIAESGYLYVAAWEGVFRYDGSSWTRIGSSSDTRSGSIAFGGSTLYATLGYPAGSLNLYVQYWTGSAWSRLGVKTHYGSLVYHGSTLYTLSYGTNQYWTGSTWANLSPSITGDGGRWFIFNGSLYVCYQGAGLYLISGSTQSQIGTKSEACYDACYLAGTIYAIFSDGIFAWDGSTWSELGSVSPTSDWRIQNIKDVIVYAQSNGYHYYWSGTSWILTYTLTSIWSGMYLNPMYIDSDGWAYYSDGASMYETGYLASGAIDAADSDDYAEWVTSGDDIYYIGWSSILKLSPY